MALLFALVSFTSWGFGGVLSTVTSRKFGDIQALFWQLIFACIVSSLFLPFAPVVTDYRMLFFAFCLEMVNSFGFLSFFKGLAIGNASLVGAIGGSFPVVSVLLSLLIYKEPLTNLQWVGVAAALVGMLLVLFKFEDIQKIRGKKILADKGILFGFLAMLIWGIRGALAKTPVAVLGWYWPTYLFTFSFLVMFAFGKLTHQKLSLGKNWKWVYLIVISMILETTGQFAYNIGIQHGYVAIVAPIAGSFPVLFVMLSRLIFKEPMTRQQTAGLIATLTGIVILAIS